MNKVVLERQKAMNDVPYGTFYAFLNENYGALATSAAGLTSVVADPGKVALMAEFLNKNAKVFTGPPSEEWTKGHDNVFLCGWLDHSRDPLKRFLGKRATYELREAAKKLSMWNPVFFASAFNIDVEFPESLYDSAKPKSLDEALLMWATKLRFDHAVEIDDLANGRDNPALHEHRNAAIDPKSYDVLRAVSSSVPSELGAVTELHLALYAKLCYLDLSYVRMSALLYCFSTVLVLSESYGSTPWIRFDERATGIASNLERLFKSSDPVANTVVRRIGEQWIYVCSSLGNDPLRTLGQSIYEGFDVPVAIYRSVIDCFKKSWTMAKNSNDGSARFATKAIAKVFPVDLYVRSTGEDPLVLRGTPCLETLYLAASNAKNEDERIDAYLDDDEEGERKQRADLKRIDVRVEATPTYVIDEFRASDASGFVYTDEDYMRLSPWQVVDVVPVYFEDERCRLKKGSSFVTTSSRSELEFDVDLSSSLASSFLCETDQEVSESVKLKAFVLSALKNEFYGRNLADPKEEIDVAKESINRTLFAYKFGDKQIEAFSKVNLKRCGVGGDLLRYDESTSAMSWLLTYARGGVCLVVEWFGEQEASVPKTQEEVEDDVVASIDDESEERPYASFAKYRNTALAGGAVMALALGVSAAVYCSGDILTDLAENANQIMSMTTAFPAFGSPYNFVRDHFVAFYEAVMDFVGTNVEYLSGLPASLWTALSDRLSANNIVGLIKGIGNFGFYSLQWVYGVLSALYSVINTKGMSWLFTALGDVLIDVFLRQPIQGAVGVFQATLDYVPFGEFMTRKINEFFQGYNVKDFTSYLPNLADNVPQEVFDQMTPTDAGITQFLLKWGWASYWFAKPAIQIGTGVTAWSSAFFMYMFWSEVLSFVFAVVKFLGYTLPKTAFRLASWVAKAVYLTSKGVYGLTLLLMRLGRTVIRPFVDREGLVRRWTTSPKQ